MENKENLVKKNKEKSHTIRNFFREIRRIKWPLDFKHQKIFIFTFLFILFLLGFFFLISFGATEILELMNAGSNSSAG